ncbi:MAG: hypothetical protein KCHDKBKB_00609 [Elusimicrobia bacterium]|nr:hypothetical protein [Elusimicrobiota bacterium]
MTNDNAKVSLRDIYQAIQEFRDEVRETYVTKAEFAPVMRVVYGLVTLIISAVFMAIIALVISKTPTI